MKYKFAILTIVAAISLAAQTTEPTSASGSADLFFRLKGGMGEAQVLKIVGRSPDRILTSKGDRLVIDGGDHAEVWDWPKERSLLVIFKHDKVETFFTATPESAEDYALKRKPQEPQRVYSAESGNAGGVERVANAISGVYLTYACPRVYRKPVIWMTAADVQLVQACNANGFMAFGVYVYTGGGGY